MLQRGRPGIIQGITRGRTLADSRAIAHNTTPIYTGEINFQAIGQKLRSERERMGQTQEQVAEVIGITPAFVGHLERAERSMSLDTLVKLCNYYHVTIDYLLSDTLPPEADNALMQITDILKNKSSDELVAILDILRAVTRHI